MAHGIGITNSIGVPVIELDSAQVQVYKTFVTTPDTLMYGRSSSATLPVGIGSQTDYEYSGAVPHILPIGIPREEAFIFVAPYQYSTWTDYSSAVGFAFHYGTFSNMRFPHVGTGTNTDGQAYTTIARTPVNWGLNGNGDPKVEGDRLCGYMHGLERPPHNRPSGTPSNAAAYTRARVVADPPIAYDFVGGTITKPDGTTTTVDRAEPDGTANVRLYFDNGNPTAGNDNAHGFNQTWNGFFICTPAFRKGEYSRRLQVKVGIKNDLEDTGEVGAYGIAVKTVTAGITTYNFNSNRENFLGQKIVDSGNNGLTPSSGYSQSSQGSGYDDSQNVKSTAVIRPKGQNEPGWTPDDAWFFVNPLFGPTYCMFDGDAFPLNGGTGRTLNSSLEKLLAYCPVLAFADTGAGHTHFNANLMAYRSAGNSSVDVSTSGTGFQACVFSGVITNHVGSTLGPAQNNSESDIVFLQNRALVQGILT